MTPRQACLLCLEREPPAFFEAALWIAAEHDASLRPERVLHEFGGLLRDVAAALPVLPPRELAQPLLRQLQTLGFQEEPALLQYVQAVLLHKVLQQRRGQGLALVLIVLELARRLEIPLVCIAFPGRFLLRVANSDHLLDLSGRRLHTRDCRDMLVRQLGPQAQLNAGHLQPCPPRRLLLLLSRQLRQLHQQEENHLAALKDAERALLIGPPGVDDHLARADLYRLLDCPQGERFDLQHALLLSEDPVQRLQLSQRLHRLGAMPALH